MLKLKTFINGHEFEVEADKAVDLVELVKSLDATPTPVKVKRPYTRRAHNVTKAETKVSRRRNNTVWSRQELDILWDACMAERKSNGKIKFKKAVQRAASQLPGRSYIAIRVRAADMYYATIGNLKSSSKHMREYVDTKLGRTKVAQPTLGTFRIPVQEA